MLDDLHRYGRNAFLPRQLLFWPHLVERNTEGLNTFFGAHLRPSNIVDLSFLDWFVCVYEGEVKTPRGYGFVQFHVRWGFQFFFFNKYFCSYTTTSIFSLFKN